MTISKRNTLKSLLACAVAPAWRVASASPADEVAKKRWDSVMRLYADANRYVDHTRATVQSLSVTFQHQSWIAYDANAGLCIQFSAGDELRSAIIMEKASYQEWSVVRGWGSLENLPKAMNIIRGMSGLSAGSAYWITSLLLARRNDEPLGLLKLSEVACAPDAKGCETLVGSLGGRSMALRLDDESLRIRETRVQVKRVDSLAEIDSSFDTPFHWNRIAAAIRSNPAKLAIPRVS